MTDKRKRPWFRFQLLTAVVMMVVASGLLWVNIEVAILHPTIFYAGLPLVDYPREASPSGLALHTSFTLPINITINIGLVLSVACLSESIIRRREGRKV